jgi:hypothetical protein
VLLPGELALSAIRAAPDQPAADRALESARRKAEELRTIESVEAFVWPADVPAPGGAPPNKVEDTAAVHLVKLATAYAFLHEVHHVKLAADGRRPADLKDEELECDRFAREFLMGKVTEYAAVSKQDELAVRNKRLTGIALGGYVLVEITPRERRSASSTHPPLALRLR